MSYHDPVYLFLFLPAVLLAYQLMPRKKRWLLLLLAGYLFFWTISGKLVLYLIGTTLFTHYIGLWLELLKKSCAERLEREKSLNADSNKSSEKKTARDRRKGCPGRIQKKTKTGADAGSLCTAGSAGLSEIF